MEILLEAHDYVAEWVAARIPGFGPASIFKPCTAIGIVKDQRLICGVVYSNYRGHDMEMSIAADGKWATKGTLRTIFSYPFGQCGCKRVTAIVARSNRKSRTLCESAGFKLEGVARKSLMHGTDDAFIYGMLREECRWFQPINVVRHGEGHGRKKLRECASGA